MSPVLQLGGRRFGHLTAIEPSEQRVNRNILWRCRCDCGNEKLVQGAHLHSGAIRSCGCLRSLNMTKIAAKHGLKGTPEYGLWISIKQRCTNPSQVGFQNYGGRGISIWPAWANDPGKFCKYIRDVLGPKPSPAHSLDRINNDGNYEPGNLRWATQSEQIQNQRPRQVAVT